MKGSIVKCVQSLVESKFSSATWKKILVGAGLPEESRFMDIQNVPDETVMALLKSAMKETGLGWPQLTDAFGEHWVVSFTQDVYAPYYNRAKTAKDFLLSMDQVHVAMTKSVPDAHPPRFEYEWKNEKTLVIHYNSTRGLVDLLPGLVKGVGKHYKENLQVQKLDEKRVQVVFA